MPRHEWANRPFQLLEAGQETFKITKEAAELAAKGLGTRKILGGLGSGFSKLFRRWGKLSNTQRVKEIKKIVEKIAAERKFPPLNTIVLEDLAFQNGLFPSAAMENESEPCTL